LADRDMIFEFQRVIDMDFLRFKIDNRVFILK